MSESIRTRLAAVVLATLCSLGPAVAGDAAPGYIWKTVKVGGGGYIPGLIFSPVEKGLAYLRSDMGGIYRWDDKAKVWVPTQDNSPDPNLRGIESIAPDPKDGATVYAAAGTYRAFPAAILRSKDRGDHWDVIPVPFRMGGNEEGRGLGERLAVDPGDTSILYFGSRYDGLQRSTDRGTTWSTVTSFPHAGLGIPPADPKAGWARPYAGLSFVVFDPRTAIKGKPAKTIFAGVADPGVHHLYRSDDAGKSWKPVAGEPASDLLPAQAQIDGKGVLYVTYANSMGPWAVSGGGVYKLDTRTGKWTNISPDKGGFMGLSLDHQHDGTLVVATIGGNSGPDTIYRSTDGGAHWTSLRELSKRDVSSVPFLYWGEKEAEFGWWLTGLAIDPFESGHIGYTTGATVYGTHDLANADAGKPMLWTPWVEGVEQTAVICLTSPAAGAPLISGFGDIGGFVHTDLNVSPPITPDPMFTNTNTIDYAELAPNVIVRSGTRSKHNRPRSYSLGFSTDFGKSWAPLHAPLPAGYTEITDDKLGYNYGDPYIDANIVVSADGATFVVMTPEPVRTADRGKTWEKVGGLPTHRGWIVADRADGKRFYALDYETGRVFVSNDAAKTFAPQATSGLPQGLAAFEPKGREDINPLMAAPGAKGALWFLGRQVLYRSTDGGKTFSPVSGGLTIQHMDFGKAAPGHANPALYAIGRANGVDAIFQSLDDGQSWQRLNDGDHEYNRAFRRIAADKRVFGRIYVATDGRGIVIGEPAR